MMEYFNLVVVALLVACVASRHTKGLHKAKQNVSNRQQIANTGQMAQVSDLIQQLRKQQSSNSNGGSVELSPANAAAINGPTGGGIGLPFGTINARIDRNPLIGANGLSKNALSDIMFGNFKGLASAEGNDIASYASQQPESVQGANMRQMLGGQENNLQVMNGNGMNGNGMDGNGMGNMMSNPQPMNLAALVAANNLAGTQGLNGFNLNQNNGLSMTGGSMNSFGLNGVSPNLLAPPGTVMNGFPGGPMQGPNPAIGMQMMSQLSNMNQNDGDEDDVPTRHHKRHHKHRKHHKKSTTKLLLRLLVDKMKDIYELDKMSAPSSSKKIKSESSAGKIGLTLDDLAIPKDDVHRVNQDKTEDSFKTNLSFPVTVSDETQHQQLKLTSDDKNDQSSKENINDDVNIQNILSSLTVRDGSGADDPAKKSDDLKINELTDSVSKDLAAASQIIDSSSKQTMPVIKGQEIRNEKANSRDTIEKLPLSSSFEHDLKMEEAGSLSEFHKLNIDDDVLAKYGIKSDLTPEEKSSLSETPDIMGFKDFEGYDSAQVTAPEIFSVSSILNSRKDDGDGDGEIPTSTIYSKMAKNLQNFIPDKRKTFPSNPSSVKIIPLVPSDINKSEDTLKSLTEAISNEVTSKVEDGANYVKAARVLGSVFKKVKDPVAKDSIQTAIKAMLQVMKYKAKDNETSATKKHDFPSDADTNLWEQIENLNNVMQKMKRHVHHKRKRKEDFFTRRNKVTKKNT